MFPRDAIPEAVLEDEPHEAELSCWTWSSDDAPAAAAAETRHELGGEHREETQEGIVTDKFQPESRVALLSLSGRD